MALLCRKREAKVRYTDPIAEFEAGLPSTYPPALKKACWDPCFTYAVALCDGNRIVFGGANPISAEWVHLFDVAESSYPHCLARGLDVRVDRILWAADAPNGS